MNTIRLLFAGLILILSSACTTGTTVNPALLQECQEPIMLEGKSGRDLTELIVKNAELWKECRMEKSALNKAIKESSP